MKTMRNYSEDWINVKEICFDGEFIISPIRKYYSKNVVKVKEGKIYYNDTINQAVSFENLEQNMRYNEGKACFDKIDKSFIINKNININCGCIYSIEEAKPYISILYEYAKKTLPDNIKIKMIYRNIEVYNYITNIDMLITGLVNYVRYELYIIIGCNELAIHDFMDGDDYFDIEVIKKRIEELVIHYMNKKNGVFISSKEYECVIDPSFCGIIIHETIGHLLEADTKNYRKKQKVNLDFLNVQYNEGLNIVDYANYYNGTLPSCTYFDAEGVRSQDVILLKNGIFVNELNNLFFSKMKSNVPNGCARTICNGQSIIRMRNTIMLPGKRKIDDMILSIDNGLYLLTPGQGIVQTDGRFKIEIGVGYSICNGKIMSAIKNKWISGNIKEFVSNISMVSNKVRITGGFCKKGKITYVGMGGPALKTRMRLE